jgi:hypothetical protein
VPDFGRVFLMLKYTYTLGLLAVPRTVPVKLTRYPYTAHVRP